MPKTMIIRAATIEDSKAIFDWRNDPETRAASLNTEEVLWDSHLEWFPAALDNPHVSLYMLEVAEPPHDRVAMCRFNVMSIRGSAEVSINLNPDFRGQKLALPALTMAVGEFFLTHTEIDEIVASIRVNNIASRRIFSSTGFIETTEQDGVVTAELGRAPRRGPS